MAKMVYGAGETYERDFFANLIKSTDEQLKKFDEIDKSIAKITEALGKVLDKSDPKTVKGITDIFLATEKLNKETEKAIRNEKAREANNKILEKIRLEEIKLQKAREKAFDDYEKKINKQAQTQQKNEEKKTKAAQKSAAQEKKTAEETERANVRLYDRLLNLISKRQSAEEKAASQREKQYNKEIAQAQKAASQDKLYQPLNKKQQLQAEQALQRQRERGIKQMEKEKAAAEEASRPYRRLERALADARRKYQDLAAAGLAETKQGREQLRVVNDLRIRYETLQKALGNNQFAVGRYAEELRGLGLGFKSVLGLMSQFGLALNGSALATGAIKTLREFDEGAADMAKTLNISKESARAFSQELLKIDTRTSVSELQKIAAIGGQLGIEAGQIVAFTQATDKLNVALGDEFKGGAEEITQVLGGLRNVFSDIKSQKVDTDLLRIGNALNVLGADGSATSPIMADFAGRIGGVGIPLGLTTDQVLGLSSTLQELNVNAERGGSAVTAILKKMTTNTADFAKVAGIPLKEFEQLVNTDLYGAFIKVVEGSKKFGFNSVQLSKILDELKVDGAGASEVFLKLGSNTELLDKRVQQANDSLTKTDSIVDEFNTKNNTLSANVEKLSKAWDEYILSADSASGATGKLSGLLQFVASNLPRIISLVLKIGAAFGIYRLALIAVNIQQQIAEKGAKGFAKELFSLKKNTDEAGKSVGGMGNALKGIAWTAIITLALEAAAAIWDIASGAAEVRAQAEAMEAAKAKGEKRATDANDRIRKQTEEQIRLLDLEQRKRIANGESEEKVIRDVHDRKLRAFQDAQIMNRVEIEAEERRIAQAEKNAKRAEQIAKNVQANLNKGGYSGGKAAAAYTEQLEQLAGQIGVVISWEDDHNEVLDKIIKKTDVQTKQSTTTLKMLKEYRGELGKEVDELQTQNIELDKEGKTRPKVIDFSNKHTKAVKTNTTALKDNNDELARRIELSDEERRIAQEIAAIRSERNTSPVRTAQQEQMSVQLESIRIAGEYQVDEIERLINLEFSMRSEAARVQAKFEIEQLKNKVEDEYTLRLSALAKERDELLKQESLTQAEREKIQTSYQEHVDDLNAQFLEGKKNLALQQELIELNLKNTLEGIDQQRADRINEINDQLIDAQVQRADKTNAEAEKAAAAAEASEMKRFRLRLLRTKKTEEEITELILAEEIRRLRELIDLEEAAGHDTLDLEIELEEKKRQLAEQAAEKQKKTAKDLADYRDSLVKEGFNVAKEDSEAREALIDKEIESSQKLADALREQAAEGNAIASQSLAAQDQITSEKIRQKQREQKEQQFIEELKLLYDGTQQYLDKGDPLPVAGAKAFVQVKGLRAIFNTLKGFYTGTKGRLGKEDKPFAPGKDGHIIRADGSEGILSGDKMDRLEAAGINTTDEITDNALAFKRLMSGAIVPKMTVKGSTADNEVLRELQDLKRTIKEKTEFSFEIVKDATTGIVNSMTLEERSPTSVLRTRHETRKK